MEYNNFHRINCVIGIHGNTLLRVIIFSAISLPAFANNISNRIVGLDNAAQVHRKVADNTYIQAGAFGKKANAIAYQQQLSGKISVPVQVKQSGDYYRVLIGPLHSAEKVREVARSALGKPMHKPIPKPVIKTEKPKPIVQAVKKPPVQVQKQTVNVDKDGLPLPPAYAEGLFVSVDAGIYAGKKSATMTVNNGSGFPFPAYMDTYTGGNSSTPGTIGATVGWVGETGNPWLTGYALGLRYKYLFSNNIQGQVIQYSTAKYTNYDYKWRTDSNVLLAQGKLNLTPFAQLLPYISGGVGVAFNRSASYSETALPDITPRISPSFGGNTQSQLAWTVGAGLDYRLNAAIILSAGYEFQYFGKIQSGPGTVEWVTERLMQSELQTNGALFSVTYVMDK